MGKQDIKVSTLMLTYNHERFIGEAIEGVLMQKTDFPCELVIAEDCSTDRTRDVIRGYWEKYPDRIRVLLNRRNTGARWTVSRGYMACRGQYVAVLDGDDYWTNPLKLQRQVDLLDRHPEHAICFHSVEFVWQDGSQESRIYRPSQIKDAYTLADLFEYCFMACCSVMYRRCIPEVYPAWYFLGPVGDWPRHVLHAQYGTIGYIDEPMGVWRLHGGGVHSMLPTTRKLRVAIEALRRFLCVMDHQYRGVINLSLCTHYCQLAHFYCDEGKRDDARRCIRECFREVSFCSKIPVRRLLNASLRTFAPELHKWCKRVGRAIVPACQAGRNPSSAELSRGTRAAECKSMNEQKV